MPNGTEVYFNMGIAAAMGGRRDEARKHFGAVIQWLPTISAHGSNSQIWRIRPNKLGLYPAGARGESDDPAV